MASSKQLAERLASVLAAAALGSAEASRARQRELVELRTELARRRELLDRIDELDADLAAYLEAVERARVDVHRLEAERQRVAEDDAATAASVERARDELRERCRQAVEALPALDPAGFWAWLRWLQEWHREARRPFEEAPDWPRYLAKRRVVDDALRLFEPALASVRALEEARASHDTACDELQAAIGKAKRMAALLNGRIDSAMTEAAGRFGKVAQDLPLPAEAVSREELVQAEDLLRYIEGLLGRFATSAEEERGMLEALQ